MHRHLGDVADVLGDDDLLIDRARLSRHLLPFATWNGVLCQAPRPRSVLSLLCASGDVCVLRLRPRGEPLEVLQMLTSPQRNVLAMSQCWSRCGALYAVARDRVATVYSVDATTTTLTPLAEISLRFSAASVLLYTAEDVSAGLLLVGTSAGLLLHELSAPSAARGPLLLPDVAVSTLTFAPDASRLVVGTVDGRVFVLTVDADAWLSGRWDVEFSTVLPSPRVTSVSWSPRHDRVVIATRKGSVHVFSVADGQWRADSKFDALANAPTGGSSPSQTLVQWWGPQAPIVAVAGRDDPLLLECYDVFSGRRVQSLRLAPKPKRHAGASGSSTSAGDSDDRHINGLCVVCRDTEEQDEDEEDDDGRLICIDSTAVLHVVSWPFLSICCPR
ncbi:hypothetical protein PINS_up007850 [Pythium insidiosum]|nr:hypothetical protein PINS_up007850 [Pythium insidiosum]